LRRRAICEKVRLSGTLVPVEENTMPASRRSFLATLLAVAAPAVCGAQDRRAPSTAYATAVKHVTVNDLDVAYVEKGRGDTVILVHGALGDLRAWGPLFDALAAKNRVVAYSMRGHFPSSWDADGPDYTAEQHGHDLMAVLKALKVGRVHLVGYGFGGRVAAGVAAYRSDMVRSLVVLEPALYSLLGDGPEDAAARQLIATATTGVAQAFARRDMTSACRAYVDATSGAGTYEALDAAERARLEDNVSRVPCCSRTARRRLSRGRQSSRRSRAVCERGWPSRSRRRGTGSSRRTPTRSRAWWESSSRRNDER
jgi:pimeloyl-ACP methyl ester carboxylesterase